MIRWVSSKPQPVRVDGALSPVGDWFRYNAETWFVEPGGGVSALNTALRQVLGTNDSVLIIRVDPDDFTGWAPPEAWNWLKTKRDPFAGTILQQQRP
jgi:hypothetical protein